jgi:hypothetical protein
MRKALPRDVHKVLLRARQFAPVCASLCQSVRECASVCQCVALCRIGLLLRVRVTNVFAGEHRAMQEDVHLGRPAGGECVLIRQRQELSV